MGGRKTQKMNCRKKIFFYFIILYWFCHTSTWICHGCTCVPNPEHLFHFPPHTISLGHPSTPAPSILYPAPRLAIHFLYDIIHVSMPFSQIIPPSLLGIHTEETSTERDTCTPMFIAALFMIVRTWEQPRCPFIRWMNKKAVVHIHNGVLLSH